MCTNVCAFLWGVFTSVPHSNPQKESRIHTFELQCRRPPKYNRSELLGTILTTSTVPLTLTFLTLSASIVPKSLQRLERRRRIRSNLQILRFMLHFYWMEWI